MHSLLHDPIPISVVPDLVVDHHGAELAEPAPPVLSEDPDCAAVSDCHHHQLASVTVQLQATVGCAMCNMYAELVKTHILHNF